MDKRYLLHVTVYCSALSPCGKYLAVGNNYGLVTVFNVAEYLLSNDQQANKHFCQFKAHPGPVHDLKTVSNYLISAGYGPIVAWQWNDIINNKITKFLTLTNPSKENNAVLESLPHREVYNCLSYNSKNNILYSGGGDSLINAWDLKTGVNVESFEGHVEYVHDIDVTASNLVSAGEDGFMKVSAV